MKVVKLAFNSQCRKKKKTLKNSFSEEQVEYIDLNKPALNKIMTIHN